MYRKVDYELHQDFKRWTELIDRAAHAENEVEREKPALQAAALEEKWSCTAAEFWRIMRDLHERRYENIALVRARARAEMRTDIDDPRSRPCA
ncbi:hypothetical protein [Nocardia sp. NBC_01009]|uniref:hypothetical protein n=1 Tax=Nocardia sp. NBC_01009 TaxID=2975996 RepID=UPI00386B2DEF|nr:hypothetical protein OHA42_26105 [Nocardia sp. NBC_01009]